MRLLNVGIFSALALFAAWVAGSVMLKYLNWVIHSGDPRLAAWTSFNGWLQPVIALIVGSPVAFLILAAARR